MPTACCCASFDQISSCRIPVFATRSASRALSKSSVPGCWTVPAPPATPWRRASSGEVLCAKAATIPATRESPEPTVESTGTRVTFECSAADPGLSDNLFNLRGIELVRQQML